MSKEKLQWHPAFAAALRIMRKIDIPKITPAVMNLIERANWKQMEEEKRMCDALNELFAEELKEADAHGRLAGKQQGGIEMCRKLGLSYDETLSQIKEEYQLTEEQAKEIMDKNWK